MKEGTSYQKKVVSTSLLQDPRGVCTRSYPQAGQARSPYRRRRKYCILLGPSSPNSRYPAPTTELAPGRRDVAESPKQGEGPHPLCSSLKAASLKFNYGQGLCESLGATCSPKTHCTLLPPPATHQGSGAMVQSPPAAGTLPARSS